MNEIEARLRGNFNHARYTGDGRGHYESYFQRANHPERPLAFWNRYTIFSPQGRPDDAIGELWSVFFNGETGRNVAVKIEVPLSQCEFARDDFRVRIQNSFLTAGSLKGSAENSPEKGGDRIEWNLEYSGDEPPLFNLPVKFYEKGFPKAKVLVGLPQAVFRGEIIVNGEKIKIDDWVGSQNHNWGSRHTDHYAWGQVAGFTNAPDVFLELATARIKLGPLWTPAMTPIVLRLDGREYRMNDLFSSFRRAEFHYFHWNFHAETPELKLKGEISAKPEDFTCLPYYNPPGGTKFCLNSKIAACRLKVKPAGKPERILETPHRAAFEILTDEMDHGLKPAV